MPFLFKLFQFIASSGAKGFIGKALQQALKGYGYSANIDKTLLTLMKRPAQLAKTLSRMPLKKLEELERIINKAQHLKAKSNLIGNIRGESKKLLSNFDIDPFDKKTKLNEFKKLVLKINGTGNIKDINNVIQNQKINSKYLKDFEQDNTDYHLLHSSWLDAGEYNFQTRKLRLWISNRFYDFPNVSPTVWQLMKEQTGSHGTGAGTIAWNNIWEFMKKRNWNKNKPRRRK